MIRGRRLVVFGLVLCHMLLVISAAEAGYRSGAVYNADVTNYCYGHNGCSSFNALVTWPSSDSRGYPSPIAILPDAASSDSAQQVLFDFEFWDYVIVSGNYQTRFWYSLFPAPNAPSRMAWNEYWKVTYVARWEN